MDAESTICLSDLVPALRWGRPQQVTEVLADPRLPGGWWSTVALAEALAVTGVDWLCTRLARLAVDRWNHLPLVELLPALRSRNPDLGTWPEAARTAVSGLGGWFMLRRLAPAELGIAAPEAVLTAAFLEVFSRHPVSRPAAPAVPEPAARQHAPEQTPQPRPPAEVPQPSQQQVAPAPPPAVSLSEYPLVGLVNGLFRDWAPLEKAVAVDRLFAEEPISLRALAHRLNVDRELLSQAQRTAEERVLGWLRSPDSAALTGHLFGLTEWLGTAATEEQLIGADPAHPVIVPELGTPFWRVLVALMPDRRLQDGWLVVGDLGMLQEKTRQLLATKTPDTDEVALLGQLGIRPHSAKAWLEALPKEPPAAAPAQQSAPAPLPRRTPGANSHPRGGLPIPQATATVDPETALAALNALSGASRGQLISAGARSAPGPAVNGAGNGLMPARTGAPIPGPATDPGRWQRIDVTSEHLRGGPVAVPEGYATQLGMRPGTLLSVTGPGDNAVVLVWRDQQPVFDSLQPVLMRLGANPGDSIYVTVDGYRLEAQLAA